MDSVNEKSRLSYLCWIDDPCFYHVNIWSHHSIISPVDVFGFEYFIYHNRCVWKGNDLRLMAGNQSKYYREGVIDDKMSIQYIHTRSCIFCDFHGWLFQCKLHNANSFLLVIICSRKVLQNTQASIKLVRFIKNFGFGKIWARNQKIWAVENLP